MLRALGLLILAGALLGCSGTSARPDLPSSGGAVAPQVQVVERIVYVPVPAWLTSPEPIAEGPLSRCPQVAAERRAALQRCNAKLAQAGLIEGTAVEDEPR